MRDHHGRRQARALLLAAEVSDQRRRGVQRVARRRGDARPRRARGRHAAAHPARRRARRQLSLGRPRQLARRCARRRVHPGRFRTFSLRFEDAEYDETEFQRDGRGSCRERAPRGGREARATSRTYSPTSSPTPSGRSCAPRRRRSSCCRASCATRGSRSCSRARAPTRCSPATISSARRRCAGSGRRQPGSTLAAAPSRAALSVPRAVARRSGAPWRGSSSAGNLGTGDAPGFAHEPRWRTAAALKRLFSAELRNAREPRRRGGATAWRRCRPSSSAGRRSPRTSTSRSARCCRATCSRRRATGCSWRTRSRAASRSSTRTSSRSRTSLPPGVQAARPRREARPEARRRRARCRTASCARKKQPYRAPDALVVRGRRRAGRGLETR